MNKEQRTRNEAEKLKFCLKTPLRRVLVVQPYGIGDLLFITPVLRALRLVPTLERVDVMIGSRTRTVIQSNPHINEIYVVDKDAMHKNSISENINFLRTMGKNLKNNHYDLLLDYSIRGENAFFGKFFLGIKRRAGYAYKNRAFFHNIRVPIPNGFQEKHAVDYACELAEKSGVPVKNRFVEFFFLRDQRDLLEKELTPKLPKKYIALSLGGGESWGKDAHLKRWAVSKFAEFSKYLIIKTGIEKIVLVGSSGECELAAEFLKTGLPAEDWTGKLSITETAWVIKQSQLFIGNDGGLLHLARAVFKPVIGIYGPADPLVYGPYPKGNGSFVVYEPPVDGKPRYFRFRYDSQDQSLQNLSVESAIEMIEAQKNQWKA